VHPARLTLTVSVEAAIIAHAVRDAPCECCGLLIGTQHDVTDVWPARNVADDPLRRYVVDPQDHVRALRHARERGVDVIGAYHSHPRTAAEPSPTDASQAFSDFFWIIAGLATDPPGLTAWWWDEGNFVPVTLVRSPEGKA
jgi:proteasome lid subunit RPN8/RPN11